MRRLSGLFAGLHIGAPMILAFLFAAALLLVLGRVPLQQNADDLLPTLMALHKLTFYYWEQDRFANLLPLLTVWITDPAHNAYAQIVLRVIAGLLAPLFFATILFRKPGDIWRAVLAADALLLLTANPWLLNGALVAASPYGTSFALAGLAGLAARRGWDWAAIAALLMAYSVNAGLVVVTVPLLALTAWAASDTKRWRLLLLHVAMGGIGLLLPSLFASPYVTPMGLRWSMEAFPLTATIVTGQLTWVVALIVVGPVVLAMLAHRYGPVRAPSRPFAAFVIAVIITTLLAYVLIATSEHVARNEYHPRFFLPLVMMLVSLGGVATWLMCRLIWPSPTIRDLIFPLIMVLGLLGAAMRLTPLGADKAELIAADRAPLAHAVAARAGALKPDGMVGPYWDLWPAVFAAEQQLHAAGIGGDILGIAPGSAHPGMVRRDTFLARLYTRGQLRLFCLDLEVQACADSVASTMTLPGLRFQGIEGIETPVAGHTLRMITVLPP